MLLPQLLNPFKPIKRRVADINADMKKLVKQYCAESFFITCYGAYYVNPKNLVFYICVQTDATKEKLNANDNLKTALRGLLRKHRYPPEASPFVHIGFESQETVDRQSGGSWHNYFK